MSAFYFPDPTNLTSGLNAFYPVFLDAAEETLTAAGAVSVNTSYTNLDSTAGAMAMTLADGVVHGQFKEVHMSVDNGDATLTLASAVSTSLDVVTFADAGDYAILIWNEEDGYWRIVKTGNYADGATAPAVA
jgi:hypothetical protein